MDIELQTDDTLLGATLTRGGSAGTVVIAGATAVPSHYYRPLATWLAETLDVDVLSFDYRGIATSRTGSLRGFEASYADWADDLATAIRWAAERGPVVVVGHSFGGHAFGMTDAHRHTLGMYTFATGAGWHGWMPALESVRVRFLWNLVAPPLVATHGYLPFKLLGMGEDLPRGVYRDWRRWCSYPNYFFDDPDTDYANRFSEVEVPVVGVNATDDAWAPPASASAFLRHYPRARMLTVQPSAIGQDTIGHMAYVRPRCRPLWDGTARFIRERLSTAA